MVSRDYTNEIGLNVTQKKVPLAVAIALVAVIAAVGAYGFHATWPASHHAKTASTTPAAAAATVASK